MSVFELPDLFDHLPIERVTFWPSDTRHVTRSHGGEVFITGYGTPYWRGQIDLAPVARVDDMAYIATRVAQLQQPGQRFRVFPTERPYPQLDPNGAILDAANLNDGQVTVGSVDNTTNSLALYWVPVGYYLSFGDFISITHSQGMWLGRVTVPGEGLVGFTVTPALHPAIAQGDLVRLKRPPCTAILSPEGYTPHTHVPAHFDGAILQWEQVL